MALKDSDEAAVQLVVNGHMHNVPAGRSVDTSLAAFLREDLCLTGTKTMCWEGGCGACTVMLSKRDPVTGRKDVTAVNSCLVPLLQCHGCEVTTAEGLGSKKQGYHPIQTRLAEHNGTQCGYCTPGMVMSMFSLLKKTENKAVTPKQVENAIDGNLCRCTGYRPIIDAFRTFADNPVSIDIEDMGRANIGKQHGTSKKLACGSCPLKQAEKVERFVLSDGLWERPTNLSDLFGLLNNLNDETTFRLVAGNTVSGLFRSDAAPPKISIDISQVPELQLVSLSTPLTVGGSVTITKLKEIMETIEETNSDYWYGPIIAEHLEKIAGTSIRNMSTIAGNLMLKHAHPTVTSDLVVIFETIGVTLLLQNATGTSAMSVADFLHTNVHKEVIVCLQFPPLSSDHVIRTFKIMPRAINAHAYINAGFRAKADKRNNYMIMEKPSIVYGGIHPHFLHAENTEAFLEGKCLGDEDVLQAALRVLSSEINPAEDVPNPEPLYRRNVALGLFYKFALGVIGHCVNGKYSSGAVSLKRDVSTGMVTFELDSNQGPLYKPIPKVEALAQTSGEAEFFDDISPQLNELHAAYVLSTVSNCTVESIDATQALALEGVVAFYDATNVPSTNVCLDETSKGDVHEAEEVFCSGKVLYCGQPVGLVVARTHDLALKAANLVSVKYTDFHPPVLTIRDALKFPERVHSAGSPITFHRTKVGDGKMYKPFKLGGSPIVPHKAIEGEFEMGTQFNFYLETHITRCVPVEDGMQVYCGTYDLDSAQRVVAKALGLPANRIDMQARRLGGAFGGKYAPAMRVAVACALAAADLKQPVRMKLDFRTNMEFAGGRAPHYCKYKVAVDNDGRLQSVDIDLYQDAGGNLNETYADFTAFCIRHCYTSTSWKITPYVVRTDGTKYTYCRGPGPVEAVAIMENIMEHVSSELNFDPLTLRLNNLDGEMDPRGKSIASSLEPVLQQLVESSEYRDRRREVARFNADNRWKKRGISIVPMVFTVRTDFEGIWYNCLVAIYSTDGSVVVTHGGIESGQGINTKVAQVVARELGIPVDMVSIKATNTLTNANAYLTGGSFTSELNCYAAAAACKKLVARMKPVRDLLGSPDWTRLVQECHQRNIDLTARHYLNPVKDSISGYNVYGATVTEVELDVLTGEEIIRRIDLIEDAGHSLNPLIDLGQVEGGFMMGVGLWTTERAQFDKNTGRKLTVGSTHYKPPSSKDIPEDFRITLLRNSVNSKGVLGCKATGEPPLCMSVSVLFALRNAVEAARADAGCPGWFTLNGPATVDALQEATLTHPKQFVYKSPERRVNKDSGDIPRTVPADTEDLFSMTERFS